MPPRPFQAAWCSGPAAELAPGFDRCADVEEQRGRLDASLSRGDDERFSEIGSCSLHEAWVARRARGRLPAIPAHAGADQPVDSLATGVAPSSSSSSARSARPRATASA